MEFSHEFDEATNDELIDAALSLSNDTSTAHEDVSPFSESLKASDDGAFIPLPLDPLTLEPRSLDTVSKSPVWSPTSSGPAFQHPVNVKKEPISSKSTGSSFMSGVGAPAKLKPAQRSKKISRRKSSTYRGVSFNIKSQRYKSVLTVNKRQIFLGYFENEEDAARAYDNASRLHRGPHARLNFGFQSESDADDQESDAAPNTTYRSSKAGSSESPFAGAFEGRNSSTSASEERDFGQYRSNSPPPPNVLTSGFSSALSFLGLNDPTSPLSPGSPLKIDTSELLGFSSSFGLSPPCSPGGMHGMSFDTIVPMPQPGSSASSSSRFAQSKVAAGSNKNWRPRLELEIPFISGDYSDEADTPRKRLKSEDETKSIDSPRPSSLSVLARPSSLGMSSFTAAALASPTGSVSSSRSTSSRPQPSTPWAKTSRFRGVSFNRKNGKFKAVLTHKGKQLFLGYFELEEDAARAYDTACVQHRGEGATLNFPPSSSSPRDASKRLSSQFRGVSWCRNNQKFKSVITVNGEQRFNGYFDSEEEAARAFDNVARQTRGPDAVLNFPDSNAASSSSSGEVGDESGPEQRLRKYGTSSSSCLTPTTADLVEKSARLRLHSVDSPTSSSSSPTGLRFFN